MQKIEIVTYRAAELSAAKPGFEWLAYVVLLNGDYWGVRFNGKTEQEAIDKAVSTWNDEKAKWSKRDGEIDPWADVRAEQHHMAGKVWMINRETGDRKRVPLTEITLHEKNGYERGGPRSK